MSDQPKNLEVIEQGGSHNLDITFLNREKSLGGTPVNPDGYDSGDPGATVTAEILVYDTTSGDPDEPSNWSTPAPALNPPTIGTLVDGGSTGNVEAPTTVQGNTKLSSLLESEDNLKWGIHWETTINGIAVEFFEFFSVVAVGAGEFGDTLFCSVADVRSVSGFTDTRDIDDDAVEDLILRAQSEFLHDIAVRRHMVALEQAPNDATDKLFQVPKEEGFIFPASFGNLEDATTLAAYYLDDEDVLASVTVTGRDTTRNRLTVATAKADTETAHLTAWLCHVQEPDFDLAQRAVCALTTHYIDLRAQQPGSIHLADTAGGRNLVAGKDTTHRKEYRRLLSRLLRQHEGQVGDASIRTTSGRRGGIL